MAENQPPPHGRRITDNHPSDPTENVKALTEAAVQRLDDLRNAEFRHQSELQIVVTEHLAQIAELRASYDSQLREAESKRIDAIRAVDIGAVQRAAEVSQAQAQILANQVAQSAEALRAQVAAAQAAAATALSAALDPIIKDIADLRRAQYEAQGKQINVTESRSSSGLVIAAVGVGLTLLFVLITLAGFLITKK